MRTFLAHFLIFLMLTPGLVCGGLPVLGAQWGVEKAQAATTAAAPAMSMAGMPCCPDRAQNSHPAKAQPHVPLLFKDCAKINLSDAHAAPVLKAPVLSGKVIFVAWAYTVNQGRLPEPPAAIRGPPPDWPALSETHRPLFLTTLRLRV